MEWGKEAERRLNEIATCSEGADGVTRLPFTPEHRAANAVITGWMTRAGLDVRLDAAATLVGRKGARDVPTLLMGSHQDSVRQGGRYDGIMGVLLPCLALEKLASEGESLDFAVEVLAFADEEGVRFPTALIGSRALAGTLDPAVFGMTDRDGITLGAALDAFGGSAHEAPRLSRDPRRTLGFLEVHIEQGPVLEREGHAAGVVSGICGIERNLVTFMGKSGHAGTVPMADRQDALVAAARFVAAVNDKAATYANLRATIGTLRISPDAVNAIPGQVTLTLEIRDPDDAMRNTFADWARGQGAAIAQSARTNFEMERTYAQPAVPCDPSLTRALSVATAVVTGTALHLSSGATHDASAMADLGPVSMLFVRCKDGVSHRPDEFASGADMGVAIDVIAAFLRDLGRGA